VCDHAACFKETGAQAVSYTTGSAAMIGANDDDDRQVARQGRVQYGTVLTPIRSWTI
jgi:hypothetical protein